MAEITAILVSYNSADVIAQALEPLGRCPDIVRIMVVDNASDDATRQLIREHFPKVDIIANPANEGFGRANNRALERVKTPYALLANPDAVVDAGAVAALLAAARRYPDAAILAPLLYDEAGRLHRSYKRSVFEREGKRDRYHEPEGDLCAGFLSGAVWLVNLHLLRKIGFFDPNLFLYYEDDDLCLRARKAGYAPVLVASARALHLQGRSGGADDPGAEFFRHREMVRSRLHLEEKYHGHDAARRLAARLWRHYALKAAYCRWFRRNKAERYRGRLAAIAEFSAFSKFTYRSPSPATSRERVG